MSYVDHYSSKIIQNYNCKTFSKRLESPNSSYAMVHDSCSDNVFVEVIVRDGKLTALFFDVQGCILAVACANIFGQYLIDKLIQEILLQSEQELIKNLLGPEFLNSRVGCVLLGLRALKKAIEQKHI